MAYHKNNPWVALFFSILLIGGLFVVVVLTADVIDPIILTYTIAITVALGAIAYGMYKKTDEKYSKPTEPSPLLPLQESEEYASLKKTKKQARKSFLSFSIVLFPCLAALISLLIFHDYIRPYIMWFFEDPDQIYFSITSFLAIFVSGIAVMFTWNLWKYISAKNKIKLIFEVSNQ